MHLVGCTKSQLRYLYTNITTNKQKADKIRPGSASQSYNHMQMALQIAKNPPTPSVR